MALGRLLAPPYQYFWAVTDDVMPVAKKPLFDGAKWNAQYRDAVVLIDQTCPWLSDIARLRALPANRIIVANDVVFSAAAEHVMALKNAQRLDFTDVEDLAHVIQVYFYDQQATYKTDFTELHIDSRFSGHIQQVGEAYRVVTGDYGDSWQHLGETTNVMWLPANYAERAVIEVERVDTTVDIMARIHVINGAQKVSGSYQAVNEELPVGVEVPPADHPTGLQLDFFVRGHGQLNLAGIHFRRSRGQYGEILVGGQRLMDHAGMRQEIMAYFDPGDLRPPLSVYFSGYQTAEAFEGFGMMRRFGTPFMLIMDPRLEGGAFYLGSDDLQQQVRDVIRQALHRLGFSHNQLILSGISMGTYAALYYGAQLQPYGIVIGKPLVNLGNIARNGRLWRPEMLGVGGFATALDMVLTYTGDLHHQNLDQMNAQFWDEFKGGDFKDTTFAVAYMYDDDYDQRAFPMLRDYLKQHFPETRVLYKGLVGRHNDDTGGVVNWFLFQYWHLLEQGFGRRNPLTHDQRTAGTNAATKAVNAK